MASQSIIRYLLFFNGKIIKFNTQREIIAYFLATIYYLLQTFAMVHSVLMRGTLQYTDCSCWVAGWDSLLDIPGTTFSLQHVLLLALPSDFRSSLQL